MKSGAVFEAPAFVSGFDDVTGMSETVEERGRHFGGDENAWPFAEGENGLKFYIIDLISYSTNFEIDVITGKDQHFQCIGRQR